MHMCYKLHYLEYNFGFTGIEISFTCKSFILIESD